MGIGGGRGHLAGARRCAPRRRPTARNVLAYGHLNELEARVAASSSARSPRRRSSISWRMTAPLRVVGALRPPSPEREHPSARAGPDERGDDLRWSLIDGWSVQRVIAFGCAITSGEAYRRFAEPGVERADGAGLRGLRVRGDPADRPHLQPDPRRRRASATISRRSCSCTRTPRSSTPTSARRSAPRCAIPTSAWSAAPARPACGASPGGRVGRPRLRSRTRYDEHGGGELPAYFVDRAGRRRPARSSRSTGILLVLSPWVVRNVRFDEALFLNYGFDLDFCLQVRAAGTQVSVADLRVVHHRSLELVENLDLWVEAHIRVGREVGHGDPRRDR